MKRRRFFGPPHAPQDSTLYIFLQEPDILCWKETTVRLANEGGMALVNVHPDDMNFSSRRCRISEYPADFYKLFLEYVRSEYNGQCWQALPRETAAFALDEYRRK